MVKLLYKPVGLLLASLTGLVASQLFDRLWALLGSGEPVDPDDREAGWVELIAFSALSGAIFGAVRAVIMRGGAKGFERATGIWPGDTRDDD